MKGKRLKKDLHSMYKQVPSLPDESVKKQLVAYAQENKTGYRCARITFWQFYWSQFKLIRMKTWILHMVILFLIVCKLIQSDDIYKTFSLVSVASPLILMTGIEEILRTFVYGTYEIETSTLYTARQVMLARAGILGGMDIVCITFLIFVTERYLQGMGFLAFFYILVPFLVTCFGCLWLLNRVKSRECLYYCYGYGGGVTGIIMVMTLYFPHLYQTSLIWGWITVFCFTVIGILKEIYRLGLFYKQKTGEALG